MILLTVALLCGVAFLSWAVDRAISRATYRLCTAFSEPPSRDLLNRVLTLERLVDDLPQKWEEMEKRATRSEQRARAVVRRAQEELEEAGYEHAGVEAEARELRQRHGGRGAEPELLQVPPGLEGSEESDAGPAQPEQDELWQSLMRKKYGFR